MVEAQLQVIATSIVSALIYSLMFYIKKKANTGGDDFQPKKLAATLIVGAVVGVFYGYYGMAITQATISQQLATYAGTIALVESALKFIVRVYRNNFSS